MQHRQDALGIALAIEPDTLVDVVAGESQLHAEFTSEEIAQRRHEAVELIVVQPVTRVLELDHFGIGKVVKPAVALADFAFALSMQL